MNNWRQYFKQKFSAGGKFFFHEEFKRGTTDLITFKPSDASNETVIKVGILENGDLITLEFINPQTPGFARQQELEYFYKLDFYTDSSQDEPGVEFNEHNVAHFNKFLKEGLKGKEVQFFKNGRIIESHIFQYYGTNEENNYGTIVSLGKLNFIEKLKVLFIKKEKYYDSQKEIPLSKVFDGV
ncbi:MAG TPA: hypothetical protein VD993_00160 [Chitinophagaceae bacterium]|nr:hypothetical protein [Chitinophagaceae bacterium]